MYEKSVQEALAGAKTVAELIKDLERMPPDAFPVFSVNYGDRSNTLQALPITEVRLMRDLDQNLYTTAYSGSGIALRDLDDDDYEGDDGESVDPHELLIDGKQANVVVLA